MASPPTEPELLANLMRAHEAIVPGNITTRNAFINVYGKYLTRFAQRNQTKMPRDPRRSAKTISDDLIQQYTRTTNKNVQLNLETRIRHLGYKPPEIIPVPVAGPRRLVQVSPREQTIRNLETALSLRNKEFINAWKQYRNQIPNPNVGNKIRLKKVYSRVEKLQKTRRQRYINLNKAMFQFPKNEEREAELEAIAQNLRNLGGNVPSRQTGMGGGSAPPPRQLPKQPFRLQLPTLTLGQGRQFQPLEVEQGSKKFEFETSGGPYNFNRFVKNYKNYRANPSSFTGVNKRKLAEVLDEFRRTKLGQYVVAQNESQNKVNLQNQLESLGLNKTYINKRRTLKKRELALAALTAAVQGNNPNVSSVKAAYNAYVPYAQFGNLTRSNVRRAKSILNPSNSWSKKAQVVFKEAVTSYNRQIRQLEQTRDALPITNGAGRLSITNKINALKRAKDLANVRKAAALRALTTTGKGLAVVAAAPFVATGGLLYGGYKGAQAGVRAGKARYEGYTREQERRRELILTAQRYVNQEREPPVTEPNVRLVYNQILRSKARKAAALKALKTTGKGLAVVAAAPFVATGGLLYGGYMGAQAGVRAGKTRYEGYTTEQARRRELNKIIRDLVNPNKLNKQIEDIPEQYKENSYFLSAYNKLKKEKIYKLAQRYVNERREVPTEQSNVKQVYNQIVRSKARKAAALKALKTTGKKLTGVASLSIKTVGTAFKKIKGKGMQKYEDELEQVLRNIANTRGQLNEIGLLFPINRQIAQINQQINGLPQGPGNNRNRLESNKQKLVNKKTKHTQLHSNAKELLKRKQELETILKRMQISKAGQVGILRKVYQRTQEYEAQKAGLDENLDKVAKQLERLNLAGSNRDKLEKRQREIKVRMAELNRLIAKRNRPPQQRPPPPPPPPPFGAAPQPTPRPGLAPALSTRGVPVNRMTNFSIKYEETQDERIKAQIIQQAYKLASDNMKKARTDTELEEMYAQYRTLGPDSRRFKDLLDMGYKTIKSRIKSKRENRGNIGKLFGHGSGNLSKLLGSESTRKILQELPTSQREAVKNAGGIARASSLIENAGGPNAITRAAEVLKKSGGNVERAALNTPSIPVRTFQNVKKLGGPTTAVRTVRVVQVVKTRVRRRKASVKKPRRVPTRKTKKKKKTSVATLKKIVHKLPRRNLEREALKWLSR